jgi:hypothetical protein
MLYFNQDKLNPGSSDGKFLLAHELTHVVQQKEAQPNREVANRTGQLRPMVSKSNENALGNKKNIFEVQRFSLFGDEEEAEKKSEAADSGGGFLDWVANKAEEAKDAVSNVGSGVVNWIMDIAEVVSDAAAQVGGSVVDKVKEKGGEIMNAAGQAGEGIMNSAQGVLDDVSSSLFESKKSNALQQINEASQKLSGQQIVFLTSPQLSDLSRHITSVKNESEGAINLPDVVPAGSTDIQGPKGTQPVRASSEPTLNLFVAANLPGGSLKSVNSRDMPEMEKVCDTSFDFSIRKACP